MADERSLSPYAGLAKKIRPEGSAALEAYQATPPRIVIRRGGPTNNVSLSLRPQDLLKNIVSVTNAMSGVRYFRVRLNGAEIGRITENETFRADISAGEHWLSIHEDGFLRRSGRYRLNVANGQTVCFVCWYSAFKLGLRKVE